MTHQLAAPPSKTPDHNGWYSFVSGEEIRCPAHILRKDGRDWVCNMYMGTVAEGIVCVRPEIRLHEGLERRQHPRFTKRCAKADGGCGTPLEIETRSVPQAAA
jgi:hypothetical protein